MKSLLTITKVFLILGIVGAVVGASAAIGIYFYLKPNLPSIDSLKDVQLQVPLRIYSKDGLLISEYGEKRRIPLKFEQIPPQMVNAFLAAEDDRFYEHPGVDYQGLLRAAIELALTGQKKQGGSTITMQVARNFFLSREKTYLRKLNEIFLALKIDQELSKNDVLTLYLNKIFLGHRAYGVGAAAQIYYGKPVTELALPQIAMIAGLPKAPSNYNPLSNPERAVIRRNYVIDRMEQLDYITAEQADAARDAPVTAKRHSANIELNAPYIAELARNAAYERFGDESYTGGYSVFTTIDSALQQRAIEAVQKVVDEYDMRHGYRGAVTKLEPTVLQDQEAMNETLEQTSTVALLEPAIITEVREQQAIAYLGEAGSVTIDWDGLKWARAYINEDRRKAAPKTAGEIVQPGDLVYLQGKPVEPEAETDRTQADNEAADSETTEETTQSEATPQMSWRLAQVPAVNGALVALDPNNGAMLSLVGGYDFFNTKFNRATQAKRQPGSGFKAFIYSAALDHGYTAASLINDAPVVFEDTSLETAWRPENYSGKFFGPTRLRYALTKSRNLVSIRLLRSIGISDALDHIEKFGFKREDLPANLSLALGSANLPPLQMARGYSVLANGGFLIDPFLVERIEQNGEAIFQANPAVACEDCEPAAELDASAPPAATAPEPIVDADDSTAVSAGEAVADSSSETEQLEVPQQPNYATRVISAENRYLMYSMMQDVITRGTATKARSLNRRDIAGKTGTTNDQRDAWFNGYNQSIVATVWVGFDDNSKLGRGEVGGKAALPGWIHFMELALQRYPDRSPRMPEGMVTMRIDPSSGKLAATGQKGAIFEVFRAGMAPRERAVQEDATPFAAVNNSESPAQGGTASDSNAGESDELF